jgi:ATP-dependent Clp protease ATP-binding subunit ClpC
MDREVERKLENIVLDAKEKVREYRGYNMDIGHLVISTIADNDNRAVTILNYMKIDTDALHDMLYQEVYITDMTPRPVEVTEVGFTDEVNAVFKLLESESVGLGETKIDTAHLFLSILRRDNPTRHIMNQFGVNYSDFKDAIIIMSRFDDSEEGDYENSGHNRPNRPKGRGVVTKSGIKSTPTLDQYCRDVTEAVRKGEVDPVVGREKEIKRVSMILSRRKKNNPVLIGEPGVGKTSIIEGLAKLIQEKKAPRVIAKKRIYSLNLASLVAGTKYRGQFEERVKLMMDELKEDRDIILFIDELHTMVGAGNASGSLDASNIFKPALANGELQIIGATTLDEFREHIEKDGALTRRFQQVLIEEPTLEETIIILTNIKDRYEEHHKVRYTQEAIEECVKLSDRYITDRAMPDKAIDVMDEAGAATNLTQEKPERIKVLEEARAEIDSKKLVVVNKQLYEEAAKLRDEGEKIEKDLNKAIAEWEKYLDEKRTEVGIDDISEVVSNMTGIPLSKVNSQENKRLLNMDKVLKKSIIGQDAAIDTVTRAIKRSRLGIKDERKPIGSFIFLGPTGVGKCICGGSKVLIRNKISGEVTERRINDLLN